MPLQDKNRPGRKVTARKIICIDTGQIFSDVHDMADQFGIASQSVYNIIRRKQVFRGMKFEYLESTERGNRNGSRTETENTRGNHATDC